VSERVEDASPERITQGALSGRCQFCVEALRMFIAAYGAEAGNLALRGMASAGVYIGGGIAPKILRAFQDGTFMDAFRDKAPMTDLVSRIPVRVIVLAHSGLLGAAVHALEIAEK
jgi:glucokinase